jgi:ligand-binding SRPBCC domain-containing protein
MDEDDVLSAELVLSPHEVVAEFHERCEEAATKPGVVVRELKEAVVAFCRMLDRGAAPKV